MTRARERMFVERAHRDLGGVVEDIDPLHQVLLVVGLQVELPHACINHCTDHREGYENICPLPAGQFIVIAVSSY